MKNSSIKICDATIQPGEKATLALPLPEQYSCSPMYMPIKVINGKHAGSCLLTFAMLNGDEFNGLEILNRLFDDISSHNLSGTLIIIPSYNIYGLTHFPRRTPSGSPIEDGFPGDEHGSFSQRLAYIFTQEILKKSDYCIEYQTGSLNHDILPQLYCDVEDAEAKKIAKAFQAPVITEVNNQRSKLRSTLESLNIPLFVYQAGESSRFDHSAIQIGLDGTKNIMKKLDMLEGDIDDIVSVVFSKDDDWLASHSSGILHPKVSLGEHVKKGDIIAQISDPFSNDNSTAVRSHIDGIIVGINRSPLVQEGLSIFKIASFVDNQKAESIIEKWEENQVDIDLQND